MEDTVVPLFFNSYLYLPKDPHIQNGYMEILPSLYSNAETDSYLSISTLAVAFFSVAAWTGSEHLLRTSERYFTRALPKIRDALQRNEDGELDSILTAILLLSTYEEFVAIKHWELPLKAHLRGAIALINSRREKSLPSSPSSTIYNAVESQIVRHIVQYLFARLQLTIEQIKTTRGLDNPMVPAPKLWPLSPSQSDFPSSPRLLFQSTASQLVNLRHSWEKMMTQPDPTAHATTILNKAAAIDNNLVSWSHRVPQHWVPVAASLIPQSVRNAGIYRNRCDCYSDMWIAATWNNYRDCRILVQNIKLSCLHIQSSHDPDGQSTQAVNATIHKLADDICASVPFFLGNQMESVRMRPGLVDYPFAETRPVTLTHKQAAPLMGAWFLFAALRNLQNLDLGLPVEQQKWVQGQVNRVLAIYFQRPEMLLKG
ncbi:hypothetical protein N7448_010682 [Penicillium atrosanguineum]|uniref:Uncharacterized protein n=1 Tax=Penicillium atrosanguineum TaxID=1132637 RepID=A0A9W9GGK7_9EURO|nr:uncharacterized protein N7443_007904 [Penicillium atrosanguineum]KAJ5118974.1 hypothetical protein N7526_010611 [Penicillium atrosanguineum]KAJ5120013.1 hypothetical protein N7448_010682 [Penicillium atrosanguineum]KAJ5297011.1 hypothetical protein N7443_007904 [Penicillium atrosanguineum]KAJ5299771.1 hypothetical protein N7476_011328 [Penicillium atrosanguineum]